VNVNDTSPELSPERFWGTYRYEKSVLLVEEKIIFCSKGRIYILD
jgi:hypothetical protein